jgi:Flp pilus assembly protein TadD
MNTRRTRLIAASPFLFTTLLWGASDVVRRAEALYQHTDYAASLRVLADDPAPEAANYLLAGKNHFMSGDYKKAVELFEKFLVMSSQSSEGELWLGRAWGRRAETSSWVMAASHATKARQSFEKAVALDPRNHEAKNDLFDYYLNAPGMLGGGMEKAEAEARSIAAERPPEYEFEEAQISEKRKDFKTAEVHLRRAMELAPAEAGRVVDLARFLAKHGRFNESDPLFEKARKMAPGQPRILFAQASSDIENHRNREEARQLLQEYLHADLTPDDPSRQEAEKLLRR